MLDSDGMKSVESANKRGKTLEHSKLAKLKQRGLETEHIWILLVGMHHKSCWIESRNRWNSQTYHQDNVQRRRRACIMGIPVNLCSKAVCGAKISLDFPSVLVQVCKKWKLALWPPELGWNRTCWYFRWKYSLWIAPGLGYGILQLRGLFRISICPKPWISVNLRPAVMKC